MIINAGMQEIIDQFVAKIAVPGEEEGMRGVLQDVAGRCPDESSFYVTIYRLLQKLKASREIDQDLS